MGTAACYTTPTATGVWILLARIDDAPPASRGGRVVQQVHHASKHACTYAPPAKNSDTVHHGPNLAIPTYDFRSYFRSSDEFAAPAAVTSFIYSWVLFGSYAAAPGGCYARRKPKPDKMWVEIQPTHAMKAKASLKTFINNIFTLFH